MVAGVQVEGNKGMGGMNELVGKWSGRGFLWSLPTLSACNVKRMSVWVTTRPDSRISLHQDHDLAGCSRAPRTCLSSPLCAVCDAASSHQPALNSLSPSRAVLSRHSAFHLHEGGTVVKKSPSVDPIIDKEGQDLSTSEGDERMLSGRALAPAPAAWPRALAPRES